MGELGYSLKETPWFRVGGYLRVLGFRVLGFIGFRVLGFRVLGFIGFRGLGL